MSINVERIRSIIKDLGNDTAGSCCECSVFIGEIDGKPIRISVMSKHEAEEAHDYEGTLDKFNSINL